MKVITSPAALQQQCLQWKQEGHSIALVPTMGYFHAGHESLIHKGRELGDKLVVTLFVNPTQFGPNEDLDAYPKKTEQDIAIAQSYKADIRFMPTATDMYHEDHNTWVNVPNVSSGLCAKTRPTPLPLCKQLLKTPCLLLQFL